MRMSKVYISAAVIIVLATLIGIGFYFSGLPCNLTVHSMSSGYSGPVTAAIEKILVIQSSPEKRTAKLARTLAEELMKQTGIPSEFQPFDAKIELSDYGRVMPMMVSRVKQTDTGGTAYRIRTLTIHESSSSWYKGVVLTFGSMNFDATFSGNSQSDRFVGRIVEEIKSVLDKVNAGLVMSLPEIETPVQEAPAVQLASVKDPVLIYRGWDFYCRQLLVYRFKIIDRKEDFAKLSKEFEQAGFKTEVPEYTDEVRFLHDNNDLIWLDMGRWNTMPEYGIAIAKIGLPLNNRKNDEKFILEFARKDLRSFVLARGLLNLRGEQLIEVFDRLTSINDVREMKLVLETCSSERQRKTLGERYKRFYRRMVDRLVGDIQSETFLRSLKELVKLSIGNKIDEDDFNYLKERLPGIYRKIELNQNQPSVSVQIKAENPEYARLWLTVQVPERPPVDYYLGWTKLPNGQYKSERAFVSSTAGRESRENSFGDRLIYRFKQNWSCNEAGSEPIPPAPGEFILQTSFIPKIGIFTVNLEYNPG